MIEILEEVMFNHIFPCLHINDLLRLRRVCRSIKALAEDYLRIHSNVTRYITVCPEKAEDDHDESLSTLLSLTFIPPFSKFHLENKKRNKSFENSSLQRLAQIYGKRVTHLSLNSITIPILSQQVINFFESFPNLEYLGIRDLCERGYLPRKKKVNNGKLASESVEEEVIVQLPSTFKTLKGLHIQNYNCVGKSVNSVELVWKFTAECFSKLDYLHHPSYNDQILCNSANLPEGLFGYVRGMIERRHHELCPKESNLKYYNMRQLYNYQHYQDSVIIEEFYKLVSTCSKYGVKLMNVHAKLIQGMMTLERWDMDEHGSKLSRVINSVQFLESSCFLLEMPHLEKILICEEEGTFNCTVPHGSQFSRQAWPNLKELIVLVDSGQVGTWADGVPAVDTSSLLNFFFVRIRREKMERLELHFYPNPYQRQDQDYRIELPCPKMRDVCSSCPNLKILCLRHWVGSNKAISIIWGKLPLLEDVTFDECKRLTNLAFVGDDKENPAFLKMTRLRKLKLEGLEEMSKLTDDLFTLVLRHMPLRELYLSSKRKPVKSITISGLKSLKAGIFAEWIETFPLRGKLELENVCPEQMGQLEKQFRSSQML